MRCVKMLSTLDKLLSPVTLSLALANLVAFAVASLVAPVVVWCEVGSSDDGN